MSQFAGAGALLTAQQATSHMVHCFLLDPAYTVTFLKQLKKKCRALEKKRKNKNKNKNKPTAGTGG